MKRDINFLYEVGSLRKVDRAWQQLLTAKAANIAEHIFRMTMVAWVIATAEKADTSKVLKMCLLHDIAESRTGDIAFMHRDYVVRHEELAEIHIFEGTALEDEAEALLKEYNKRETLEAKIVKDADNLDVDLELNELSKVGDSAARSMQKDHRPVVRAKKLYTKTAQKMWDEIKKKDPNDWHRSLTGKWLKNKKGAR